MNVRAEPRPAKSAQVSASDPATPYLSWAAPQFMGRYGGDYDHLARLWEWGVIGGAETSE